MVAGALGIGASMLTGGDNPPHDASVSVEPTAATQYARRMWLLLLEALGALLIFVFIVWWTMFSGRRDGERRDDDKTDQ
jgi:heme/copper-type cytochrome/quinol oxidase subunit 2